MTPDRNPEPVPYASQLAVLPFLAAVEGFLVASGSNQKLRITLHRIAVWENNAYFQQLTTYLGTVTKDQRTVGRMLALTTGIIGAAFESRHIWRTKRYSTEQALLSDLQKDMRDTGDDRPIDQVARSYLAIPLLGPQEQVVVVLYADCFDFNFFANDSIVAAVRSMCNGFCRLFDWLQDEPFPTLRNFPLQKGDPIRLERTVYPRLQEAVDQPPPKFERVSSFNYEASVD